MTAITIPTLTRKTTMATAAATRKNMKEGSMADTDMADVTVYTKPAEPKIKVPKFVTNVIPGLISLVCGLAIWTFVSTYVLGQRAFLLPAPAKVLTGSLMLPDHFAPMMTALLLTTRVALFGLLLAFIIGVVTAIIMKHSKLAEKAIYPYAVILQTIPVLALVPLIGLWFGYGFASRTTVCVLFTLFPIISNTLFGLQNIDQGMVDLFQTRQASFRQRLWMLELPAALPSIFTGLKTSSGLSVVGAVVADMYFTQGTPGIGTLITVYTSRLQSTDLFAAIVMSAVLGLIVFEVFNKLSDMVIAHWHLTRSHE
ncbi:ABC transporter permease [Bifidobacterium avesanii]|uniref:ABC transporter permease subunit n=1 Tax=Bifidobacterium avesanii TaxID=1798157 RepID=A0A7K3TL71_9BIFI|nr:ABC transporter permease [Bifidobacterium avesanii]KAB8291921.1 nitrate ABC transporter permease [Bifidobacterium avesanii]NEG79023.1 ABC transporter permease subunit [Bifidobacterium avesanii]